MSDATDLPDPLESEPAGESVHLEPVEEPDEPRTYPSTPGGLVYIVLLLIALAALVVVVLVNWRVGIRMFAGTLFAGALARLALKERDAGMLAVRSKPVDAFLLTLVGGVLVFLASSIPDQPL